MFNLLLVFENGRFCGEVLDVWCVFEGVLKKINKGMVMGIVVGCVIVILIFVCFMLVCFLIRCCKGLFKDVEKIKLNMVLDVDICVIMSKFKEFLSINIVMFERLLMVCFILVDILYVINNFCKINIIGDGGFGIVYKVVFIDGRVVVIKKLGVFII